MLGSIGIARAPIPRLSPTDISTMGLKILEGRNFTLDDNDVTQPVAVVNAVSRRNGSVRKARSDVVFASSILPSPNRGAASSVSRPTC
jgi:hypothetical protein